MLSGWLGCVIPSPYDPVRVWRAQMQAVMVKLPALTDADISPHIGNRDALLKDESLQDFGRVCKWLQTIAKTKDSNQDHTCYSLGKMLETTCGVVIAAAVHCGFRYSVTRGFPVVYFAMSTRSIKAARPALLKGRSRQRPAEKPTVHRPGLPFAHCVNNL